MGSFRLDFDATNKIIRISFEGEETGQVLQAAARSIKILLGAPRSMALHCRSYWSDRGYVS